MCKSLVSVIFFFQCTLISGALAESNGEKVHEDSIAAVVGDQVITVSDVREETKRQEERLRVRYSGANFKKSVKQLRQQAANRLVARSLFYNDFQEKQWRVPSQLLNNKLDEKVVEKNDGDWDKFEAELREKGQTLEEYKEDLRKRLAVKIYLDREVRNTSQITEKELRGFYQKHQKRFRKPKKVKLQRIVLPRGQQESKLQTSVQSVMQSLEQGKPFSQVAQMYSKGEYAEQGGKSGWIKVDSLKRPLQQAVGNLKPNRTTPIQGEKAVYFLRIVDRKDMYTVPFENVRDQIVEVVKQQKWQERYNTVVEKLKKKYFCKIYF